MAIKYSLEGYLIYATMVAYAAAALLLFHRFRKAGQLAYLLGFVVSVAAFIARWVNVDHVPLQNAGIRAIDVIDLEFGPNNRFWHTLEDTFDKVSAESLQIVGDVAVALLR